MFGWRGLWVLLWFFTVDKELNYIELTHGEVKKAFLNSYDQTINLERDLDTALQKSDIRVSYSGDKMDNVLSKLSQWELYSRLKTNCTEAREASSWN